MLYILIISGHLVNNGVVINNIDIRNAVAFVPRYRLRQLLHKIVTNRLIPNHYSRNESAEARAKNCIKVRGMGRAGSINMVEIDKNGFAHFAG